LNQCQRPEWILVTKMVAERKIALKAAAFQLHGERAS
jgi:hypothetical protein